MNRLETLEIEVKGIIDIVNKLNDIDTIVSFDSIKMDDKVLNCYWLAISMDFKGKIKHTNFYFFNDDKMLDNLFNKIIGITRKVGGYIG